VPTAARLVPANLPPKTVILGGHQGLGGRGSRGLAAGGCVSRCRLSRALIALNVAAGNKGSLSSLIPLPGGPLLPATAAWHVGGTGAGTHPGTLGTAGDSHRDLPSTGSPGRDAVAWGDLQG